jgi:hypothetical protein
MASSAAHFVFGFFIPLLTAQYASCADYITPDAEGPQRRSRSLGAGTRSQHHAIRRQGSGCGASLSSRAIVLFPRFPKQKT